MTKNQLFLCILIFTSSLRLNAQNPEELIPFSFSGNLPEPTSFVDMETFDTTTFLDSITKSNQLNLKSSRFAKTFTMNLSPGNSGEWINTARGKVWRVAIRSGGAYSVYVSCNPFLLNEGVRAFVYAPAFNDLRGPFSSINNNRFNRLSFPLVSGDVIIVELDVPDGQTDYGRFAISKLYHDCSNEFGKSNAMRAKAASDNCTENINCGNGTYWQTEKRAVCKIVSDGQLSTGTLMGNASGTRDAYILTANHTMFDSTHVAEAVYYFNYETETCSSDVINQSQYITGGSSIAATKQNLDFTLIKLSEPPPLSFRSFYAGWDKRSTTPGGGICIHHPWGAEKQIAIEYHPLPTASFSSAYDLLAFWKVQHWEIGTTQPGSSGSPLFNPGHRLVGTLTGGESECGNAVNDYFSKFALAWNNYSDSGQQLKSWLDPDNTGAEYIDGYDPYGFTANSCDTAWNFQRTEALGLSSNGLSWGYLSGHNSAGFTQFAEKFISTSSIQIPGVFINVARAYHSQALSNIVVKVWEGNAVPVSEKYAKTVFIRDLQSDALNYIGFDSIVKVSGNFFIGYEINYTAPPDTFAVYHTQKPFTDESSSMYVFDGVWQNINSISSANMSASLGIGITECYGKIQKVSGTHLRVYPNPCTNQLTLELPQGTSVYGCQCFDLSGRKMTVTLVYSEDTKSVEFNLPAGAYILKLITNTGFMYTKFMVSAGL